MVTWDIIFWVFILIFLVVPVIYSFSGAFRYYVKIGIYYAIVLSLATFICIAGWYKPFHVDNYKILKHSFWCVKYILGIEMEVRGKKHLDIIDGPYIITCNHQSSLDFMGMMEIWPDRCTSLAKKELRYAGVFGVAAWLCGTVFIDRLNHEKALKTMVDTANTIKEKNIRLYTFPEGTRNRDGHMLPFKKGVFHLAVQSQVPIIPVIFSSFQQFYNKSDKRLETGKVIISILPPIYTKGLKSTDVTDLCNKVRNQMEDVYYQTSLEVTPSLNANGHSMSHNERRSLSASLEGNGVTILERIEEESLETSVETLSPDISPTERQKNLADRIVKRTVADAQETIREMIKKNKVNSTEQLAQEIVDQTVREAQELIRERTHVQPPQEQDDSERA